MLRLKSLYSNSQLEYNYVDLGKSSSRTWDQQEYFAAFEEKHLSKNTLIFFLSLYKSLRNSLQENPKQH